MKIETADLKWGSPLVPLNLDKVFHIVIHHLAATHATPEQIHRWHLDRGWKGAAYNEYIRKDGRVIILRGDHIGGHTANNNSKTYGIAVEGNYDIEKEMPKVQFDTLVERLVFHKKRMPNDIKIVEHKYFSKTACPGKFFGLLAALESVDMKLGFDEEFYAAVDLLTDKGVIRSPEYWKQNARENMTVKGEFAKELILNMAKALRS